MELFGIIAFSFHKVSTINNTIKYVFFNQMITALPASQSTHNRRQIPVAEFYQVQSMNFNQQAVRVR